MYSENALHLLFIILAGCVGGCFWSSAYVLCCNTVDSISDGRKFLKTQIDGGSSLFYAQVPGGKILLHHVEKNEKFPAQFGREVAF